MHKKFIAGLVLLAASASAIAQSTEFDVTSNRLLVSANTISTNVTFSDVSGPTGNNVLGKVRMYYDYSDTYSGYASKPNFWNYNWSQYLQAGSALGPLGPLGYTGPLSSVGPLWGGSFSWGSISWFPSNYSAWVGKYFWNGDPLFGASSPYGPSGALGANGPLSEKALYRDMPHLNETIGSANQEQSNDYNDFPHQLDPSGVWGILGPVGPLGALGPLGPLGRMGYGSSGLVSIDSTTGDMIANGQIKRTVEVQYDTASPATYRQYELSELYPRANLVSRQTNPSSFVNDTSFSVDAVSPSCTLSYANSDNHTFYFKSKYDQFVSIVLTNTNAYAELDFDVYIKADTGNTFNSSTNAAAWFGSPAKKFGVNTASALWNNTAVGYQDFAVFRVKKNDVVKVVVKAPFSTGYDLCGYLLHVTGSGFQTKAAGGTYTDSTLFAPRRTNATTGNKTFNITGVHQQALSW